MKKSRVFGTHLLSLALATVLAACGGGQDPATQTATPAATLSQLQAAATALNISGVAPEEAARQLMDTAETTPAYQEYFPTKEATQSQPPFAYRFYPSTRVYLGVVVTPGLGYEFGRVYVMGGPFGDEPSPVGLVTDYITPAVPPPVQPVAGAFAPACTACGATGANSYAGTGTGIWQKTNTTNGTLDVPVSISGLNGQDVTLVFTNESLNDVVMPPVPLALQDLGPLRLAVRDEPAPQSAKDIAEFNRTGWADRIARFKASQPANAPLRNLGPGFPAASAYAAGSSRSFYHSDGTYRDATLRKQVTTSDGTAVNFWVENSEFATSKVTASIIDQLAGPFARAGGVYDILKSLGGPLWGPHTHTGSLLPANSARALDILVLNHDRNGKAYGLLGYFWGLHNLSKSVDSRSNESLILFLDSETLYLGGTTAMAQAIATLTHEGLHMSNFYRRSVLMGPPYAFDTWLEEMTALQMEDIAAMSVTPAYSPVRDNRMRNYLSSGSYNCALRSWKQPQTCDSYALASTFGGFLLRHLGIDFYKSLLYQPTADSMQALQDAIDERVPGSTAGEQLRRFAASTAAVLPLAAPATYGYPARTDSGFTLPGIDVSLFKSVRVLPQSAPTMLASYANFPVARKAVRGTFSETVRVPVGATLTVVVR